MSLVWHSGRGLATSRTPLPRLVLRPIFGLPSSSTPVPRMQLSLGSSSGETQTLHVVRPFKTQLLKWIGNKQRFAHEIIGYFPEVFNRYHEPFLGSGGVLGTLAPHAGSASDVLSPLVEIWTTLRDAPSTLKDWYTERYQFFMAGDGGARYDEIRTRFSESPNGADLLFLSRSCYGGVIRFRRDGYMSTPLGVHKPITPSSFAHRVDLWYPRVRNVQFRHADFEEAMNAVGEGDVVYCDPPYSHTQSILYGAQEFDLGRLFRAVAGTKLRGATVLLSIDGTKKSGDLLCDVPIPSGLFDREAFVNCGRSMLRRFQREGETLDDEVVRDRLLISLPA